MSSYDPVPQTGPKTYCVEYQCEEHPSTTEPVCSLQVRVRLSYRKLIFDFKILFVYDR